MSWPESHGVVVLFCSDESDVFSMTMTSTCENSGTPPAVLHTAMLLELPQVVPVGQVPQLPITPPVVPPVVLPVVPPVVLPVVPPVVAPPVVPPPVVLPVVPPPVVLPVVPPPVVVPGGI